MWIKVINYKKYRSDGTNDKIFIVKEYWRISWWSSEKFMGIDDENKHDEKIYPYVKTSNLGKII